MKFQSPALPTTKATTAPIAPATFNTFDDPQHGAALFNSKAPRHFYNHFINSTISLVARAMTAIKIGIPFVSTNSLHNDIYHLSTHVFPISGMQACMV